VGDLSQSPASAQENGEAAPRAVDAAAGDGGGSGAAPEKPLSDITATADSPRRAGRVGVCSLDPPSLIPPAGSSCAFACNDGIRAGFPFVADAAYTLQAACPASAILGWRDSLRGRRDLLLVLSGSFGALHLPWLQSCSSEQCLLVLQMRRPPYSPTQSERSPASPGRTMYGKRKVRRPSSLAILTIATWLVTDRCICILSIMFVSSAAAPVNE